MIRAVLIAGAIAGVLAIAACGGDGNKDQEAIEDAIRAFEQAWNDQDYDAFAAVHTEDGIKAELQDAEQDLDTDEGRREAFEVFSEAKTVISKIGDIEVDGDTATAAVEAYQELREDPSPSSILLAVSAGMVKDGDAWKIDALEFGWPDAPDGAKVIKVQANEFAFSPQDEPDSGNIVFEIENVGKQPHHVTIEKAPDDLDIEEALQSEEEPEGLVHIGSTPPWEPGETATIVFTEDLEPGRYVMLCFMPDTDDPEGTPHALKGMYKEFRIN
jgi:ketosteroid isomerase-like protein